MSEYNFEMGQRVRIEPATPELIAEFAKQRRDAERSIFLAPFLDHWVEMSEENLEKVAVALGFTYEDKTDGN